MKRGSSLKNIAGFDEAFVERLAALSITTAEELLAHVAVEGEEFQRALDIDSGDLAQAVEMAESVVGPDYVKSLGGALADRDYGYGALPPTSEEFSRYVDDYRGEDTR